MIFKSLVGNKRTATSFADKIKTNTMGHAYILEGPSGSGKHTLAMEICKALFCTGVDADFPCCNCHGCSITENGYNTDIITVNRGERANISVDTIREMLATVNYQPDGDGYKVYIIEEAEKMNVQAQNALLLSLEEPPSYVIFLLLCSDSASLLETVRSRAQTVRMERFSPVFVADYLRESPIGKKSDANRILACASVSNSSIGSALEALEAKNSPRLEISKEAGVLVETMLEASLANRLLYCNALKYSRQDFSMLFDFAQSALRDLIALKSGSTETVFYPEIEKALELSGKHSIKKIVKLYDSIDTARRDITSYNASVAAVMTSFATGK